MLAIDFVYNRYYFFFLILFLSMVTFDDLIEAWETDLLDTFDSESLLEREALD